MASYFCAPNYSGVVSVPCESPLFISFRMAFAVNLVCMRNTMITILYRQLATATLWLPLVYGEPLPLCVSKRDSHVTWDFQIMTLRKCL